MSKCRKRTSSLQWLSDSLSGLPISKRYDGSVYLSWFHGLHFNHIYDTNNPSAGAVLTYYNGAPVSGNCQSQFSIAFMCADFPFPSPVGPYSRFMHYIQQVDVCQYIAYAPSQVGCPQECPIVNGAVCSGKGICGFDNNLKTSRCFCDDGYDEVDCNTPTNPFPSGAVAGSTIGGLALGAAGIFGWTYFAARRNFAAPSVDGFYGQM